MVARANLYTLFSFLYPFLQSGSERTSRSRTASTATTSATSDAKSSTSSSSDKAENGDGIDYKALWEAAKWVEE